MSVFPGGLDGSGGAGASAGGAGAGGGVFDWLKKNITASYQGKNFSAQFGKTQQQRQQEEMMEFIKKLFTTIQPNGASNRPQNESRSSVIKSPGNSAIEPSIVTDLTGGSGQTGGFNPLSALGGLNLSRPTRRPDLGGGNPLAFLSPGFNPGFSMR